ncbi:hypothetical protein FHU33_3277 [Blastococcus colisei]|uniref:Uncharacterized protein n=1 Tax=Blastococcus colisei TaxID=1564162 RepID=A0A543PIA8_9ACTN|nr:hypothetical protein [Blastococcus colisei]TQN43810.1 hypothetical protein FHU33_3277 [Blastococcus colisei]
MNKLRRSYEARVLLIPLGPSGLRTADEMARAGLDGLVVATVDPSVPQQDGQGLIAVSRPLGAHGWREPSPGEPLHHVVRDADIVILLASDLSDVSAALCEEAAAAASRSGALTAAVVVGSGHWDTHAGSTGMVALRRSVDMLVVVKGLQLAAPFLDVLRGGARPDVVVA